MKTLPPFESPCKTSVILSEAPARQIGGSVLSFGGKDLRFFGPFTLSKGLRMTFFRRVSIFFFGAVLLTGCHNMEDQPRVRTLAKSKFFKDGISARALEPGTIPIGFLRADEHLNTGKIEGRFVTSYPFPITREVLEKGKERFNIFCAVCHNQTGTSDGMIVRRGFKQPPSQHEQRLRDIPVGYLFDVITNGFGNMPRFSPELTPEERWTVVAYLRTLQLSQNTPLESLTPGEQKNLVEMSETPAAIEKEALHGTAHA